MGVGDGSSTLLSLIDGPQGHEGGNFDPVFWVLRPTLLQLSPDNSIPKDLGSLLDSS